MEKLLYIVIDYITLWSYSGIGIGMALESACIPIPSELILGFAGYLVYLGQLDFGMSVAAGVVGGLIGSCVAYMVGFYGGHSFVVKYGRYVFLSEKNVRIAQKWFDRYGLKTTFFSRLLPVIRTFISLPAGFAQVNFGKFIIYTLMGSIPWTTGLIYAGMVLGENWQELSNLGHKASLIVAAALVTIAIYYYRRNCTPSGTK